ncbi:MAG: OsmC family protein [Candidatus Bathyarchaeota archaeon]|nr:OsmC family protein [Candidatus Bathyarchaeota archaeon]
MSEPAVTKLKLLDGYRFNAEFNVEGVPDLIVDEAPPLGGGAGPNPAQLLSVAVGHCMSSSLLFCLQRSRIKVKNLETTLNVNPTRNAEGRLRIKSIDVKLHVEVAEEDKPRLPRCLEIFENYCTVTQSVRQGIDVSVDIK